MKQQLDEICRELIEYFGWKKETVNQLDRQEALLANSVFQCQENNNALSAINTLYSLIEERGGYRLSFCSFAHLSLPRDFTPNRLKHFKSYIDVIARVVSLYEECKNQSNSTIISSVENREVLHDSGIDDLVAASELKQFVSDKFVLYRYRGNGVIEAGDVYKISPMIHFTLDINRWIKECYCSLNEHGLINITLLGRVSLSENISSDFVFVISKQDTIWLAFNKESVNSNKNHPLRLFPYRLLREIERDIDSSTPFFKKEVDCLTIARQNIHTQVGYTDIYSSENLKAELVKVVRHYCRDIDCSIHVRGAIPIQGRGDFNIYIIKQGIVIGKWNSKSCTLSLLKNPQGAVDLTVQVKALQREERGAVSLMIETILSAYIDKECLSVVTAGDMLSRKIAGGEKIPNIDVITHFSSHMTQYHYSYSDILLQNLYQFDKSYLGTVEEVNEYLNKQWLHYLLELNERRFKSLSMSYDRVEHITRKRLLEKVSQYESGVIERLYEARNFSVVIAEEEVLRVIEVEDRGQLDIRKGTGIGRYVDKESHVCSCCNGATSKSVKKVFVFDYRGLLYLFNTVEIEEIPQGYQTYMNSEAVWRSLRQHQNHPFSTLIGGDMCSIFNQNHIVLNLYSCGRCHNRLSKDKQEALLINLEL